MPSNRNSMLSDIVLMYILRHGGEWPDWGKMVVIHEIAGELRDKKLAQKIQNLTRGITINTAKSGR